VAQLCRAATRQIERENGAPVRIGRGIGVLKRLDDRFDETQAEAETPPRAALSPRPVWFREVERTSLSQPSRRAVVGHGPIRWRDTRSLDPRELRCRARHADTRDVGGNGPR
jgi:hypothetical protein